MKIALPVSRFVVYVTFPTVLLGCASNVVTESIAQPRYLAGHAAKLVRFTGDVEVESTAGYSRTIKSGSLWEYVGSIPKGNVYRSADGVFTIEGSNVHEAYLVVDGGKLTSFYLPVERALSPLKDVQAIDYVTMQMEGSVK